MQVQENVSLKSFNTFGINVKTKFLSSFNTTDELEELLNEYRHLKPSQKLILGGGSNILFTKDFDGLVLKNNLKGIELVKEDEHHYYLKVAAGENWHSLVMYCIERNFAGLENLSLIPGNVGASPMQNIGAYGVEIKDLFESLEAYHINDKKTILFTNNDCQFGYRESVFKRKYKGQFVILSVIYRLNKIPVFNTSYGAIEQELQNMQVSKLSIKAIAQAVINIRSSKLPDPNQIGNAGSFFKNPQIPTTQFQELKKQYLSIPGYPAEDMLQQKNFTKVAAGWLIEQCGWKGYREGDAGCHAKQALVLVNYGNAKGNEIFQLSQKIINSVKDKFSITLEREVNIV